MDEREQTRRIPVQDVEGAERPDAQPAQPQTARPERTARREQAMVGESLDQVKQVISMIEQRIGESPKVPLRKGLCVIDSGTLIDLISQLRIALPKAVLQAQDVLQSRETLLEEARTRADEIANEADALHSRVVGEANHLREQIQADADAYEQQTRARAEADAQAMIDDANTRAEQIIYAAQQKAQQMLDNNEITRRAQTYALETRDRAEKDADTVYNQACVQVDKMLSGAVVALTRSANDLASLRDNLLGADTGERR